MVTAWTHDTTYHNIIPLIRKKRTIMKQKEDICYAVLDTRDIMHSLPLWDIFQSKMVKYKPFWPSTHPLQAPTIVRISGNRINYNFIEGENSWPPIFIKGGEGHTNCPSNNFPLFVWNIPHGSLSRVYLRPADRRERLPPKSPGVTTSRAVRKPVSFSMDYGGWQPANEEDVCSSFFLFFSLFFSFSSFLFFGEIHVLFLFVIVSLFFL